jgi:hypothetical protein
MKVWVILIIICMSFGISLISAHIAAKIWGKEVRVAVFIVVFVLIWACFWLGMR